MNRCLCGCCARGNMFYMCLPRRTAAVHIGNMRNGRAELNLDSGNISFRRQKEKQKR